MLANYRLDRRGVADINVRERYDEDFPIAVQLTVRRLSNGEPQYKQAGMSQDAPTHYRASPTVNRCIPPNTSPKSA